MAKSFTTLRWLRPYESKDGRQVFIRIRVKNGFETEIPVYDYVNHSKVPISVKKEHWNKGYVTGGKYHKPIRDINNLLAKVEGDVKDAVHELLDRNIPLTRERIFQIAYINEENALINERNIASGKVIVNEDGGAFASQSEFEGYVASSDDPKFDALKKAMGIYERLYILDYWDDFIKTYAPNSYNSPKYAIESYILKTGDNCKVSEFSAEWMERFFKFQIQNGYSFRKDGENLKNYSITTIVKYQKHLKAFGDYLFSELKILNNQDYRRFFLKKNTKKKSLIKYDTEPYINTHALYKKEFDWFYAYKFQQKELEIARDMFVLQTWLGGLRQTDFYSITEKNIHRDSDGFYKLWFEQKKTDDEVINVINSNYLSPIIEKYGSNFIKFPKVYEYNRLLKKAAREASLNREMKFRKEYAKNSEATIEWYPIYEKICNKWARNCAVSILAEEGYPNDIISRFIGHRDEEMINHYKQMHPNKIKSMMEAVKPEIIESL